jgi:hypothetical protein
MGGRLQDDHQRGRKLWYIEFSDANFSPSSIDLSYAVLEGANPSTEGEDADEGGNGGDGGDSKKVLDIEDQFRLNKIEGGMDKKTFTTDLKCELVLPSQARLWWH